MIRKHLGYYHIPKGFAKAVNAFTRDTLSPWLNHHPPCLFASERRDAKGKTRKRYLDRDLATPYEKFRSLPDAARYLKPGLDFECLDAQAHAQDDIAAAVAMNQARDHLFSTIYSARSA